MNHQERNWLDLPSDVMLNILNRIGIVDILENAQKVCTVWRKICKIPLLWRVINMNDLLQSTCSSLTANAICKNAIDRSQGQLVDITLIFDSDTELFPYVVERSSQLRRIEIVSWKPFISVISDALMNLPLLEEVNFYSLDVSKKDIETLGRYCPMLKTLKVNETVNWHVRYLAAGWKHLQFLHTELSFDDENGLDDVAIAIGQNLVGLRHLELIGNRMTNIGLQAILDHCQQLEKLDLRACFLIDITGDLGKKCFEQIKHLKVPDDSLEGCSYYSILVPKSLCDYDLDNFDDYGDDL